MLICGRSLAEQHLAEARRHEYGIGQLQTVEQAVEVPTLQHPSSAARARVEAVAEAEVRLVLNEVLRVADLLRRAGAEEPEQLASRAQQPNQLRGQDTTSRRTEIVEDIPAQHGVHAPVAEGEASRQELQEPIKRALARVAIEIGVHVPDVDLAAEPLAQER